MRAILGYGFLGRRSAGSAIAAAILAAQLLLPPGPDVAWAQEQTAGDTEIWQVTRGGRLYDNWMKETLRDAPEGNHPAYPAAAKQKGAATWRCKECHGWDYMGVEGAYSTGSHTTGIKGIRRLDGGDPDEIAAVLRDDTHKFTAEQLPDQAVEALALFVSRGQIDMDSYIDRDSRKARGDANRGARFYQTICAVCHGFDGKEINFADEAKPEYIGTVASENPWETLHKIVNGQPGAAMVSLAVLPVQDLVDIVAYAQTLPAK